MNREQRNHLHHELPAPTCEQNRIPMLNRNSNITSEITYPVSHTVYSSHRVSMILSRSRICQSTRISYTIAIVVTIVSGLAARRYAELLPPLLAIHAGDMLWAMMVYWSVRLLADRRYDGAIVTALLFCYGIEFSQLYQGEWIRQLRDTLIGGLVLGHGFLVVDLLRYTVGVLLAVGINRLIRYMWHRRS
ncbi:DUF2809 domain-containing protein [Paenibacillus campi]|uniref:ribosomal maturation YjgA family protein n=1 Tax=Paenibacillus campi TaxID=3106031 RepID=UPI002AFF03DF|nr:DUF2809 domain-containing protein [Paenibacillus sp. SGZ-1014]